MPRQLGLHLKFGNIKKSDHLHCLQKISSKEFHFKDMLWQLQFSITSGSPCARRSGRWGSLTTSVQKRRQAAQQVHTAALPDGRTRSLSCSLKVLIRNVLFTDASFHGALIIDPGKNGKKKSSKSQARSHPPRTVSMQPLHPQPHLGTH